MHATRLVTALWASFVVVAATPSAFAQAQMYLSQSDVPGRLTEQGLRNFMRAHQARRISEEDDHKTWKFHLGTFFRSPPGDLEMHLLFYDVEHGSRVFVSEMAVFLSSRDETTFLQHVSLQRPQFKPQNRYQAVLTVRRTEMASANFELIGRPVERSGVVEFSDSETEDPDRVTAAQQNAAEEAQRVAIAREQARQQEYQEAMAQPDPAGGGGGGDDTEGGEEEEGDGSEAASGGSSRGGCASCTAVGDRTSRGAVLPALLVAVALLVRRRARPA